MSYEKTIQNFDVYIPSYGHSEYNRIFMSHDFKILKSRYKKYLGNKVIYETEYYNCIPREKTMKEKAEELKNRYF